MLNESAKKVFQSYSLLKIFHGIEIEIGYYYLTRHFLPQFTQESEIRLIKCTKAKLSVEFLVDDLFTMEFRLTIHNLIRNGGFIFRLVRLEYQGKDFLHGQEPFQRFYPNSPFSLSDVEDDTEKPQSSEEAEWKDIPADFLQKRVLDLVNEITMKKTSFNDDWNEVDGTFEVDEDDIDDLGKDVDHHRVENKPKFLGILYYSLRPKARNIFEQIDKNDWFKSHPDSYSNFQKFSFWNGMVTRIKWKRARSVEYRIYEYLYWGYYRAVCFVLKTFPTVEIPSEKIALNNDNDRDNVCEEIDALLDAFLACPEIYLLPEEYMPFSKKYGSGQVIHERL